MIVLVCISFLLILGLVLIMCLWVGALRGVCVLVGCWCLLIAYI